MAKGKKSAKALTDDWIKQVVTGQKHKLAHMKDGGEVDEPAPETPATEPVPEPTAPEAPRAIDTIPADPGSTVGLLRGSWGKINAAIDEASGYKDGGAVSAEDASKNLPVLGNVFAGSGGIPTPAPVIVPVQLPAPPLYDAAQAMKDTKPAKSAGAYKNGGCVKRMEKGGDVDGPGTGTSDSVPAMLSDGEYVLPADTVAAVGKATLDKLKNATHTPVHKPAMQGMVMRADGGDIEAQTKADRNAVLSGAGHLAAAAGDIASQPVSLVGSAYNELLARPARAVGVPLPNTSWNWGNYGPTPVTDAVYGADGRGPATPVITAPAPTSTATTAVDDAPMTQTAPTAAPATAKPITAPDFMPTLSGPNTAQDMVSEGRTLMNTQGIGGFVQAKGLNRMAQTVNQTNEPLIRGQYELQNTAMTANERLEQAKLAEHQRQQNLETWTPDKNMMGELMGYGRTKGGTPQYVTKESLMAKPTLAQYIAKNSLVNPKATTAEHTAQYNARYGQ